MIDANKGAKEFPILSATRLEMLHISTEQHNNSNNKKHHIRYMLLLRRKQKNKTTHFLHKPKQSTPAFPNIYKHIHTYNNNLEHQQDNNSNNNKNLSLPPTLKQTKNPTNQCNKPDETHGTHFCLIK